MLVEGLDVIVLTAVDACRGAEEFDLELLLNMTADRGDLMERIRTQHFSATGNEDMKHQANLMYLTTLFERLVWMFNQLGRSLRGGTV